MKTKSYIKMIMSLLFIILIFSCSSSEDKRKTLIKAYGEPDIIEKGGYGTLKYQLFIYLRKDLNRVYDLRQSGSGCGGNSDYYIYYMYYANELGYELYLPPTIVHTPVTTAPAGTALKVTADVTDDNSVSQVVLYYLHKGLTDSTSVNMYYRNNRLIYFQSQHSFRFYDSEPNWSITLLQQMMRITLHAFL